LKRNLLIKLFLVFLSLELSLPQKVSAQIKLSGTVFDSTKLYVIPGVNVSSTAGLATVTDSLGAYHINVSENDSLSFFYRGKSTIKFPVKTMGNYNSFDISLHVRVNAKYKLLQSVTVFADNYHRDSAENRMEYSKIFNFEKPRIRLIGMFNRRKKRENLAFQNRLIDNEKDRYVNYRFGPKVIHRVTGLSGDTLLQYRKRYMPSYDFVVSSTLAQFYEYILNTSYAFKKEEGIQ
jgi:hypothetical protein